MYSLLFLLLPAVGYFVGSIPFGLLIGRMAGVDVRLQGSKNIGATNVNRVAGVKFGVLTLICDVLKGSLPMLLTSLLLPEEYGNRELIIALTGVMSVLGHMFSCFLGFKGGKGVATGLGVFLVLSPVAVGISLGVFVVAVLVSGFVSLASVLASGLLPFWLWILDAPRVAIVAAFLVALLIILKHHENIRRLLNGEEKSWRGVPEKRKENGERREGDRDWRQSGNDINRSKRK
ncbi:glycerol-3-phosphate 1-O-acyltransferase PlsY [Desulforhopalus vacuolatus]|uniref:glycerol-3-phosphate 1-O-acyltransferase PlsY n=1 Tax=Desulforhopalus vacuolatus TaxID=40414 RepID=UPI0019658A07|nr:glycerol-3-phosphate 1-O-acyltransferase PlsY [Desulforhopalus vacuolatus]MBM9519714.1 glycerol-3-phosphate 1-O-acyltransferase PlsY [Desulforhopalus vacuolatus]